MGKWLIEVPHEDDKLACLRAIQVFLETGSHFLVNADWGCLDGEHKAWIILEGGTREDALSVLPLEVRPRAKVTKLTKFKLDAVNAALEQHQD